MIDCLGLHVRMFRNVHIWHEYFKWPIISASFSLHRISFVLINYAENELLNFGKWKNFMFDQWLAICWDIIEIIGYNTFLKNHSDVCNFAKLVDLHFRQRMKLKFDTNLLLFWSTFWLMDKVTKLSPGNFPFVSKIIEAKDHVIGSF